MWKWARSTRSSRRHHAALASLWVRGGFPDSYLARSDAESLAIRDDFIRTYLERDVPQFGPRFPAETLERVRTGHQRFTY